MKVKKWDEMSVRERDALVAEKVMHIDLTLVRSVAMVKIGWDHISSTGEIFQVRVTGRDNPKYRSVYVPPGESLAQPEGTTNFNDRYAFYIAQLFEEQWADEINAVYATPKPYTSDISASFEVVEKMRREGWAPAIVWSPTRQTWLVHFTDRGNFPRGHGESANVCDAICVAALRVCGAEV